MNEPALERRLGTADAVVIGLGSMIGDGVFSAFGPAARAAGTGLLIGLMLAAVIKVLRTPGLTYRWLWVAFALVGLFSFQMNWATGVMLVQWMALQIVGFWLSSGPSQFDPWMISATVPIGALLILSGLVARKPAPVRAPA